jgi:hypothetical protein
MAETVKGSIQIGEKLVMFEGPRDFVEEQVARFASLVPAGTPGQMTTNVGPQRKGRRRSSAIGINGPNAGSCISRILTIRGDGFFAAQRTISEIRSELATRGWHYPLTTLSGRLQTLVQQRHLRREKIKDGRKKIWRYSNV